MEPIVIVLIASAAISGILAIIWLRAAVTVAHPKEAMHKPAPVAVKGSQAEDSKPASSAEAGDLTAAAQYDVEHVFNTEFREELRNRGRLYFEKIINENAMFLQQDLRLTTSQLNDYMKQEIKKVLQDEFSKYEESIKGAKDLAIASIEKTQTAIEEQRNLLESQLLDEVNQDKERILSRFERDMAEIVNHYVLTAIGEEIDVTDQLEYIVQYLEQNKQAIVEDLKHGAV